MWCGGEDPFDILVRLWKSLVIGALAFEDVGHGFGCIAVAAVKEDDGVGVALRAVGDVHVVGVVVGNV